MTPSLETRKPACDLTEEDLRTFPIWEFAADEEGIEGQDESWVRPVRAKQIPRTAHSQLVSSMFKTPNGEQFFGYMDISPGSSRDRAPGGALLYQGQPCFLMDLRGPGSDFMKRDSLEALKRLTKKSPGEIFPLSFELLVLVEGEPAPRKGIFAAPKKA